MSKGREGQLVGLLYMVGICCMATVGGWLGSVVADDGWSAPYIGIGSIVLILFAVLIAEGCIALHTYVGLNFTNRR